MFSIQIMVVDVEEAGNNVEVRSPHSVFCAPWCSPALHNVTVQESLSRIWHFQTKMHLTGTTLEMFLCANECWAVAVGCSVGCLTRGQMSGLVLCTVNQPAISGTCGELWVPWKSCL